MHAHDNASMPKANQRTWIIVALAGIVVLVTGLIGSVYVVQYIDSQLLEYESGQNKKVANELNKKIGSSFKTEINNPDSDLNKSITAYKALGFRTLLIDKTNETVVFDSGVNSNTPIPLHESLLAGDTSDPDFKRNGYAVIKEKNNHSWLIWYQPVEPGQNKQWLLAVIRNQQLLREYTHDMSVHMYVVISIIFALLLLWGYFSIRVISRLNDRFMENKLAECTAELDDAYKENLHKSRLAMIGQTASVLAHEMHNPMSSIKLALSGLKGSENLTEREVKRVNLVLGEVDRLDSLLSETLDYVRPVKISEQPIDLELLFQQIINQQGPVLKQKNIKIDHQSSVDSKKMCVDKAQFHQVLLNLIKNAIEASPSGGEIKTAFKNIGKKFIFEISNSGDIMDRETLERAFEPFYTTKPKGTGLGLGLVKRVVDEHGGSVDIQSDSNIGTKFVLSFEQA
jgi:signal transduction histidine kinase